MKIVMVGISRTKDFEVQTNFESIKDCDKEEWDNWRKTPSIDAKVHPYLQDTYSGFIRIPNHFGPLEFEKAVQVINTAVLHSKTCCDDCRRADIVLNLNLSNSNKK